MRSPRTRMKSRPRSLQLEKARAQQRRPNAAKIIKKKKKFDAQPSRFFYHGNTNVYLGEGRGKRRFYPYWSKTSLHLSTCRAIHLSMLGCTDLPSYPMMWADLTLLFQDQAPIAKTFWLPLTSYLIKKGGCTCIFFL